MKTRGIEHLLAGTAALGAVAVLSGRSRAESVPLTASIDSFGSGMSFTFFGNIAGGDEGSNVTMSWDIIHEDGINVASGEGAIFTHTFSSPGSYVVNLSVNTEGGDEVTSTERIDIEPDIEPTPNNPPVAKLTIDVSGNDVFMSGGQSFDEDGDTLTYRWEIVNENGETVFIGIGESTQTTLTETGLYRINLVVEDEVGAFDIDKLDIEIREPEPRPPPSDDGRIEAPPPEGSISQENLEFGSPVLEASIYQSQSLADENDRAPEKTVANFLSGALDDAGISYKIHYSLPLQDPPKAVGIESPEDPRCEFAGGNVYPWWEDKVNNGDIFIRKDANLLLLNSSWGGCGSIDGRYGVMGTRRIDNEMEWRRSILGGRTNGAGQIFGAIHEIAHMLGFRHDRHWGISRNMPDEEVFEKTLAVGDYGTNNVCGEFAEEKRNSTVRLLFEFTECAKSSMSIE